MPHRGSLLHPLNVWPTFTPTTRPAPDSVPRGSTAVRTAPRPVGRPVVPRVSGRSRKGHEGGGVSDRTGHHLGFRRHVDNVVGHSSRPSDTKGTAAMTCEPRKRILYRVASHGCGSQLCLPRRSVNIERPDHISGGGEHPGRDRRNRSLRRPRFVAHHLRDDVGVDDDHDRSGRSAAHGRGIRGTLVTRADSPSYDASLNRDRSPDDTLAADAEIRKESRLNE
jgi:hypothetical protein